MPFSIGLLRGVLNLRKKILRHPRGKSRKAFPQKGDPQYPARSAWGDLFRPIQNYPPEAPWEEASRGGGTKM